MAQLHQPNKTEVQMAILNEIKDPNWNRLKEERQIISITHQNA